MSKKMFLAGSVVATLVAIIGSGARAEQTNEFLTTTNRQSSNSQPHTLTPEQRAAKIQEIRRLHGFTNAPVSLTAEERRARMKQRTEELRRKEAAGTLTPVERQQLQLLERSTNRPVPAMKHPVSLPPGKPASTNFNLLSK